MTAGMIPLQGEETRPLGRCWEHPGEDCWYLGTLRVFEGNLQRPGSIVCDFYRSGGLYTDVAGFSYDPLMTCYVARFGDGEKNFWAYPGYILRTRSMPWNAYRLLQDIHQVDTTFPGSLEEGFALEEHAGSVSVLLSPFMGRKRREYLAQAVSCVLSRLPPGVNLDLLVAAYWEILDLVQSTEQL